jgi:undecaprenyl-diphosphatase
MSHMTYLEASVVGLIQGVTELFPVSSLGHNVLIPALVGGSWARDLNVGAPESPYLAFIVGLHVATALAMIIYFWRDYLRLIAGLLTSLRDRRGWRPAVDTADQKLAWMIIIATVPVGIVGLAYEHEFRVITGKAITAGYFLIANGLILLAGERFRTRASRAADLEQAESEQARAAQPAAPELAAVGAARLGPGRHSEQHLTRQRDAVHAVKSDQRLARTGYLRGLLIGSAQIFALLAGISRDGVVMVSGMVSGLSRQDAARFSFLLSAPVIFAAGALKVGDLTGPLGDGIRGQVLVGSLLSGIGAYLSVRYLVTYFRTRTLTPFAIYCLVFGAGSISYLSLR